MLPSTQFAGHTASYVEAHNLAQAHMGLLDALRRNSRSASKHQGAPSPRQFASRSEGLENNENLSPASPAAAADTPLRPKALSLTPLSSHASQAAQSSGRPPAAVLRVLGNGHTVRHASAAQHHEWEGFSHALRCALTCSKTPLASLSWPSSLLYASLAPMVCHALLHGKLLRACSQARAAGWALWRPKAAQGRTRARYTSRSEARGRSRCCAPQAHRPIAARWQSQSLRPRRSPQRRCCQRRS